MKLTLVLVLFLIAAIIFAIGFLLGWAPAPYGAYSGRLESLAFGLMAVAFLLWHGGQ